MSHWAQRYGRANIHATLKWMRNASVCSLNQTACRSEAQPGCITCYVSQLVWIRVRKLKQNNAFHGRQAFMLFKDNRDSVVLYAKQTLAIVVFFFFFKEIHKMMLPAHTPPQNGCYFASASMWQKAIYILHTQCKLTTTLQQRSIVNTAVYKSVRSSYSSFSMSSDDVLQNTYCDNNNFVVLNSY